MKTHCNEISTRVYLSAPPDADTRRIFRCGTDGEQCVACENVDLRSTISRLREYADHARSCMSRKWDDPMDCDCGYDELIKEVGEGK